MVEYFKKNLHSDSFLFARFIWIFEHLLGDFIEQTKPYLVYLLISKEMSVSSDLGTNIYEEALNDDTACDLSFHNLDSVPKLDNKILCVSYWIFWFTYFKKL